MRLFGFEITRRKALSLSTVDDTRGWLRVFDGPGGWFQQDHHVSPDTVLAYHAVYACTTLIAADIGKLRPKLVALDNDGIWNEVESASFSPVLRKPNNFQNHIQFKEWWILSKLIRGNAYALKVRDARGIVVALYLLDATRVTPLVSESGDVYYRLGQDNLAHVEDGSTVVPASEIIHDRMNCLFHPLVGVSPIYASGMAAEHGLRIQRNSSKFFSNNSMPGGVLIAPGEIKDDTAARLKKYWEENFTGDNAGRIAVVGDGLKFEPMRMTAVDSQLIEQLRWTAEVVCSCFHVPGFMIGVGNEPSFSNGETRTQHYYNQCLQSLIESMELCLDEGLGLHTPKAGVRMGVELDLDGLLRMDMSTQINALKAGVDGTIIAPNEARKKLNYKPLPGGDAVYKQVQNYSLEALAERDKTNPLAAPPAPNPAPALPPPDDAAGNDKLFHDADAHLALQMKGDDSMLMLKKAA